MEAGLHLVVEMSPPNPLAFTCHLHWTSKPDVQKCVSFHQQQDVNENVNSVLLSAVEHWSLYKKVTVFFFELLLCSLQTHAVTIESPLSSSLCMQRWAAQYKTQTGKANFKV